ncbi:unnamed protein product [Rotaria socialis]
MSSGQQEYIQKGIKSAEQATAEDKAHNYEAAAQHYMTATDWLFRAMKYGEMNPQMKQAIRPKIESYMKRAEEIVQALKKGSTKEKAVVDTSTGRGNSNDNKGDDDDNGVGTDNAGVLVLAATNIPWALDTAIRRRFEKSIYIPLPGVNQRAAMFKTHVGTNTFHMIKEHEWMQLAQKSEHYSGADIGVVCREALLRPIRRLGSATHFKRVQNPKPYGPRELWVACSPGDPDAQSLTLDTIEPDELCEPPVTMSDMLATLDRIKSSINEIDMAKYRDFTETFGASNP